MGVLQHLHIANSSLNILWYFLRRSA